MPKARAKKTPGKPRTRRRGAACSTRPPAAKDGARLRRLVVRLSDAEHERVSKRAGAAASCGLSTWARVELLGIVDCETCEPAATPPAFATVGEWPNTAHVPVRPEPGPRVFVGAQCGNLYTPQGTEGACYELRSASSLITSHNPETWEPDPRYPTAVQERDYRGDVNERGKVQRIGDNPAPDLLLALTPTAVDGPPVIASSGVVLGGNGRTMGLRRAYKAGTAGPYREELARRAPIFGLRPEAVESLADPVLVRTVRGLDSASQSELAAASSRYNEGMGNALDARARAVSLSRRLSQPTLTRFAELLEKHETLRAAMAADGPAFVRRLEADDLVTAQNRAALVDAGGGLTESGKELVEGAFLGLVFETPERLARAAPGIVAKVERMVPGLARVRAQNNGHDAIPRVQAALDLLHSAAAARLPVREFAGQGSLFDGARTPPDVLELADLLETGTQKRLALAARQWAGLADYDPRQPVMFLEHPKPEAAWGAFLESARKVA